MGNLIRAANRHRFRNLGSPVIAIASTQAFAGDLLGTYPGPAALAITNGGYGILNTVSASIAYTSGAGWLASAMGGAANSQSLTLTPSLSGLVVGVYQALVTLTSSGAQNSGVVVTVTATITDTRANLQIAPTSLDFTATLGQASAPTAQTITATNAGSGTLSPLQVSITGAGAAYIGATVNGTGNAQTVIIAPSVPSAEGSYGAVVTVSALNATGSPDTVSINYNVLPSQTSETIGLSRSALSFVASVGNAAPAAQTTEPGNLGPGTLGTISVGNVVGTAAAYFTFTVTGTGNNQVITATPTVPLAQGTYTLTADVTATNASNTATLSVSYAVAAAVPTIALSPSSLSFSQATGLGNPAAQVIAVSNSTGGTLATCSTGFSGTNASSFQATVSGSGNAQRVSVTALTGILAQGTYTATLTINSGGASNTPVTVPLTFIVTASSTIRASTATLPADITQNSDGSFTPTGWRVFGDVPAAYLNGGTAPVRYVGALANAPVAPIGGLQGPGGVGTVYPYTAAGYAAAVTDCARGDVIVVEDYATAGSTSISTTSATAINYPAKSASGTTYIYIVSRKIYFGTFPRAYLARVAANYADRASCAVLTYDATVASTIAAWHTFTSSTDCSYWRFVGVEFWNRAAGYTSGTSIVPRCGDIMRIGTSIAPQSTPSTVPSHIIFDRCYAHGDWRTAPLKHGIHLNANYVGMLGCDIGEAYQAGTQTQGIIMINCDGPLHCENTSFHDASEPFQTGGANVLLGSPHLPSDLVFLDCYFWRDPASFGVVPITDIINLFEFKFVRRALVTGCVFDGNGGETQRTAIKLKTTNQQGSGVPWAEVIDVTFWHCIIANSPEAFGLIGQSEDAITTIGSQRYDLFNILVKPLDVAPYNSTTTRGWWGSIAGPFNGLIIEHCTGFQSWNSTSGTPPGSISLDYGQAGFLPAGASTLINGFVYKNNISGRFPSSLRFVLGTGHSPNPNLQGTHALNAIAPGFAWANNLITGLINGSSDTAASYPQNGTAGVSGNKYTTLGTSGGTTLARADILFTTDTDPNVYGDWTLQGGSPAHLAADDGRDMGVIWTLLNTRTARALSGATS